METIRENPGSSFSFAEFEGMVGPLVRSNALAVRSETNSLVGKLLGRMRSNPEYDRVVAEIYDEIGYSEIDYSEYDEEIENGSTDFYMDFNLIDKIGLSFYVYDGIDSEQRFRFEESLAEIKNVLKMSLYVNDFLQSSDFKPSKFIEDLRLFLKYIKSFNASRLLYLYFETDLVRDYSPEEFKMRKKVRLGNILRTSLFESFKNAEFGQLSLAEGEGGELSLSTESGGLTEFPEN